MQVISTIHGYVLYFEDVKEIENLVKHLSDQIEFIKANDVKPPHLYASFAETTPIKVVEEWLNRSFIIGRTYRGL